VKNREHRHRRERWSWNTSLTPVGGHRLFETGRIRLELGININICREDAEHFQLRVSTEEQLLLRNIVTVLQANPNSLTLTRMQAVSEMAGRMLFDQFVKSPEEKRLSPCVAWNAVLSDQQISNFIRLTSKEGDSFPRDPGR
jgi:hypothetical protein